MGTVLQSEEMVSPATTGAAATAVTGALVVGGDHPGLGVVRSLGRHGVPVVVVDDQPCISRLSRYATRVITVEDILDERKTVDSVLEVGHRFNLRNWVLIPTRDETVAAFSRYRSELADFFRVTTGEWDSIEWAWDKAKTYQLAETLGIPCPKTFVPKDASELPSLYPRLPLAIKPAVKENFFYATGAKAWRADTPEQLNALYAKAAKQIRAEEILIQEIIPGDGLQQYSWCAFARNGRPHSTLSARRMRQHPREFGRAATYVETIDAPEIDDYSERFIKALNYHGLVEIEYKRDTRDGQYKLLDVNARAWGFHALGRAAGVDFAWLLYADRMGLPIEPARARAGVGWLRLLTDIPTAFSDMTHGYITVGEYFRSLRATGIESVFSWRDPLPSVFDTAMVPWSVLKKYPQLFKRKSS
jgi:predicted ATP-grasp superfamily ATP-dependent carboligase